MNSKITSKKALEAYHRMANGNSIIIDDTKAYETIKQDLDKLEKLENDYKKLKERYQHRAETSNDLCEAVKQYEKVIDILVDKKVDVSVLLHLIECGNDTPQYYNEGLEQQYRLTQEEYELLKEVLKAYGK